MLRSDTYEKEYFANMTVTDIIEYNQKKVLVQLDGHLTFPIYKRELAKYHIEKGTKTDVIVLQELLTVQLPKRVKLRAMELLKKRSYTTEMLRRKLLEGHYPEAMVEEALSYVSSYGYLDDLRYAEEYIRCYSESKSKRRILQDLHTKGITAETAEEAWKNHEESFAPIDELSQIKDILRKKHFDPEKADYKETVKMMQFLYRKGYRTEHIQKCIRMQDDFL